MAGQLDEKRDADQLLVKRVSMLEGTVLPKFLAVVRRKHYQRFIVNPQSLQLIRYLPHVVIDETPLAFVEFSHPRSLGRRDHHRSHANGGGSAEPVTHTRRRIFPGPVSLR